LEPQLEGFPGPLHHLITEAEEGRIDLCRLSLSRVAASWWEEAQERPIGPDDLVFFIKAMARLLELKAQALLYPQNNSTQDVAEGDEISKALAEWPFLAEAVQILRAWEGRRAYPRPNRGGQLPKSPDLGVVSLRDLAKLVQEALQGRPQDPAPLDLHEEVVRLQEKVEELEAILARNDGPISFQQLLQSCQSRREVIVLFLAVLELLKQGRLWAYQSSPFAEILIAPVPRGLGEEMPGSLAS